MNQLKEKVKSFMEKDWSLIEKLLLSMTLFMGGIITGFLFSPIKKGICTKWYFLSHNGSYNSDNHKGKFLEDLDDKEKSKKKRTKNSCKQGNFRELS